MLFEEGEDGGVCGRDLVGVERISVNLDYWISICTFPCVYTGHTFAIRARRKERMRNLNLSSSVCKMTRVKFDLGSIVPIMSSIVSIYASCS